MSRPAASSAFVLSREQRAIDAGELALRHVRPLVQGGGRVLTVDVSAWREALDDIGALREALEALGDLQVIEKVDFAEPGPIRARPKTKREWLKAKESRARRARQVRLDAALRGASQGRMERDELEGEAADLDPLTYVVDTERELDRYQLLVSLRRRA